MSAFLHQLIAYLHSHPHMGGLIAFLIAFSESLAIIGSIIPGSVTMTAIGALIGSSVLPLTSTIIWAIAGAMAGDVTSYWFGAYYQERIRNIWPFKRYPHWLDAGEAFFRRHGGKSVIIGRFAGVMRSAVPMIAGILRMPFSRFICVAIPAAFAWAIVYISPGILVGALAAELPAGIATKFILVILLIITVVWLSLWLIHLFFRKLCQQIDKLAAKIWHYFNTHKPSHWICTLLHDPHPPNGHTQLLLAISVIITALLFLFISANVLMHGWLTHINIPVFTLLRSLRNHALDHFMLAFTLLGNTQTLLIFTGLMSLAFLFQRHYRALIHWIGILIVSGVSVQAIKLFVRSPRPGGLLNGPISFSFPSGHTCLSLVIFGFLAFLIAHRQSYVKRKITYRITIVIITLIALSRLYLGAHWVTDVLGSIFLGLTWVLLFTLIYRRKKTQPLPIKKFIIIVISSLLIAWASYGIPHYKNKYYDYTPYWPTTTTTAENWWNQQAKLSLYITSRLGKPSQPLNIQWLDSLDHIKTLLQSYGWAEHPGRFTLKGASHQLAKKDKGIKLPLLPKLYHNQAPALLMTKQLPDKPLFVLRLWRASVEITGTTYPLWIGSISEYLTPHRWLSLHHHAGQTFISGISELLPTIKNQKYKLISISINDQPQSMLPLNWDGELLLIRYD